MQEHLKKRKICQCSEQQQVCNLDVTAAAESSELRDAPDEGLPELAAAGATEMEAAASCSLSPAQQWLPVQPSCRMHYGSH
ncbi:hypothetical protein V5799_034113 [Amblyomma americanum]|uniref:Uncharacterized protein n=1 Tax=Amblyomma americanum TaxID=6943 RepID=A0AAQ4DLE2_AMBAM